MASVWTPTNTVLSAAAMALLASITSAAPGTSLIGYNLGVTGSVGRTLQNKLALQEVDVMDFAGVTLDGSGDCTAGVQAAIDSLGSQGGIVNVPEGILAFSGALNFDGKKGIWFKGAGRSVTVHNKGTVLKFTGTVGPFLNLKSSTSVTIEGFRIVHSDAGFTGYLLDGSHGTGSDTSDLLITKCHFGSYTGLLNTARGIQFNQVISSAITNCTFDSLVNAIDGQDPSGGSYSNVIYINQCQFSSLSSDAVRYCGESWTFTSNTFEPTTTGTAKGVLTTSITPVKGLTFTGNWLGDVSSGSTPWLTLYGNGVVVQGNRFGGVATMDAISLNAVVGFFASGNNFILLRSAYSFDTAGCKRFIEFSNYYDTVTNTYRNSSNQNSFSSGASAAHTILPNGKLQQWGKATVTTGTPLVVNFPQSYGTTDYAFTWGLHSPSGVGNTVYTSAANFGNITLNVNGTAGANIVYWQVIGDEA